MSGLKFIISQPYGIFLIFTHYKRTEKDLSDYFGKKAKILETTIMKDPQTDGNMGSGFIKFSSFTEAENIINEFSGKITIPPVFFLSITYVKSVTSLILKIHENEYERLKIPISDPKHHNRKLKIMPLPVDITEEKIKATFEKFGQICDCYISHTESGIIGSVKYAKTESAILARNTMNNAYAFENISAPISVYFSSQKGQQNQIPAPMPAPIVPIPAPSYGMPPQIDPHGYQYPPSNQPLFVEYTTPEGKLYYFDTVTRNTQWDKPIGVQIVKAPPPAQETVSPFYGSPMPGEKVAPMPSPVSAGHMQRNQGAYRRGPPGCNLFVFHLPNEWSEPEFRNQFAAFGNLISARIMTDKESGRSKGYGTLYVEMKKRICEL